MVHINQVEFENFKSFGGIVKVPLEEGFTVVTGPNGSGKSNILDGILFCLGLASSRGMRAERLPDLINTAKVKEGKSCETSVSVKFDIGDWSPREDTKDLDINEDELSFFKEQKEWTVSRKLRLMPGGSYASTYSSDGKSCTLQQIQKLLRDIRVDHEGSNVVMQGDVTRVDNGIFKPLGVSIESNKFSIILKGKLIYGLFKKNANSCQLISLNQ